MKKICTKCHKEKSLDQFYRSSSYSGGYRSQCKECINDAAMAQHKKKPRLLIKKPCRMCGKVLGKHRSAFCSPKCSKLYWSKASWREQKKNPTYKKQHRNYMRGWLAQKRKQVSRLLGLGS